MERVKGIRSIVEFRADKRNDSNTMGDNRNDYLGVETLQRKSFSTEISTNFDNENRQNILQKFVT